MFFVIGCASPSDREIKSLIPVHPTCIEPLQFDEITVGSKQTVQTSDFSGTASRSEWYPVRVRFSAKCLPRTNGIVGEVLSFDELFGTEEEKARSKAEREETIKREGVMKSFTKEYRFRKNEYDEWVVVER